MGLAEVKACYLRRFKVVVVKNLSGTGGSDAGTKSHQYAQCCAYENGFAEMPVNLPGNDADRYAHRGVYGQYERNWNCN